MKSDHYDLCDQSTNLYYGRYTDDELHEIAYSNVVALRGSDDVPAFTACVSAEFKRLKDMANGNS